MKSNIDAVMKKLASNDVVSEDEIAGLVADLRHFRTLAAYLAGCHAATADSLPKSASKSAKSRMVAICQTAARGLGGDITAVRFPTKVEHELEYCETAANRLSQEMEQDEVEKKARAPRPR